MYVVYATYAIYAICNNAYNMKGAGVSGGLYKLPGQKKYGPENVQKQW